MSAQTIEGFFPEFLRGPQFARQRLKEAIECLALEWFARTPWAARMTFIGGTCLRLAKGIDRFSEDLDFDCKGLSPDDFAAMTDGMISFLRANGLPAEAKDRESTRIVAMRRSILFPGLLRREGLSPHAEEKFLMKVEAQDQGIPYERTSIDVSRCGCFFPVATPPEPVLCAMKLSALLSRSKGRDFYDSIFLLQRTGPDYAFLTAKHGIRNKVELKTALRDRLRSIDLENKKRDVEHLLFHSANAARILRFSEFVEGL